MVEKIRKVKYLQDQFELRARSNLAEVMENEHSVLLEGCTQTSFKLSPEYLASDEARPIILRILSNRKTREHIRKNEAGAFSEEDMKVFYNRVQKHNGKTSNLKTCLPFCSIILFNVK